ncbi:hypothetical protein Tco_0209733 [Tanacetum coccineum]
MSLGSCGIANLAISQLGKFSGGGGRSLSMGELGLQAEGDIVVPLDEIQLDDKLHMIEEPVEVVDREKELQEVLAEPIPNEIIEKAQFESDLSITNNDINIELSKEFLEELQMNAYHGWIDEDVMDHITKVLEMIDLIYIPGVGSPSTTNENLSSLAADNAKQWWINEGKGKITVWEELVEKFFCKFYPES